MPTHHPSHWSSPIFKVGKIYCWPLGQSHLYCHIHCLLAVTFDIVVGMHLSSAAVSAHVESCWHFAHASCNYVCTKLVTLSNHSNSWISIMLLMFLLTKWWLTCIKFDFENLLPYNTVMLIALRKWNCQETVLGRNKMPNFNPCWGTVVWRAWIRNCTPHTIGGYDLYHLTYTRHVVPHM